MNINLSNMPSHHQMVERLVDAYNGATQYEKIDGLTWYSNAFQYAATLHVKYGYSIDKIIDLISVISPGSTWETNNVQLPERMLSMHLAGIHFHSVTLPLYPSNITKAQQILDGERGVLKGNKVRAFADAIRGDSNSVAIDGWMVKMLYANPGLYWKDTAISSDTMYHAMSDAVRDAAMFVGVAPAMLQAVTWVTYRNQWKGRAKKYRKHVAEKKFLTEVVE